ncbi:MAG: 50S ribosomal protein L15 [Patescibacteria group bacterium]|nr:50S ribosomal protein L15 [Patescibacteria group bacterium]MDE2015572.1 50S ribosomal protein L15 [Patescibacteria group bacterium]MDE2227232.1 50S ribosomal protein L15 [Patescibacteria group bacterium]
MQLHQLTVKNSKRSQRIGRGGKRGTTSGRGQKGQKSRSGHRMRPAQRDLILRLPKKRGFRNKEKSVKPIVVNLDQLELKLKKHGGATTINKEFLQKAGILSANEKNLKVKILGDGQVSTPLRFEGLMVSKTAKEKIEKAGGTVVS